jgi:hypothetical protein
MTFSKLSQKLVSKETYKAKEKTDFISIPVLLIAAVLSLLGVVIPLIL